MISSKQAMNSSTSRAFLSQISRLSSPSSFFSKSYPSCITAVSIQTSNSSGVYGNGTSITTTNNISNYNIRHYVSRAHPQPTPQYSILDAIQIVLEQTEIRKQKRQERWDKHKEQRKKGILNKGMEYKEETPYRNQDESICISMNLNLDPRKPNQSLRGQLALPHGTGRVPRLAIFSLSQTVISTGLENGAVLAGGNELVDSILEGNHLDEFDRVIATPDIMPVLGKKVARILGPRGLMPNPKMGNIVNEVEVTAKIKEQLTGMVPYRTDKAGIVHAPIGKFSFGQEKLEQNLRAFIEGITDVEPELDKRAQKQRVGGKGGKFVLKLHLNATQGKGVMVDLKTADPNSPFFMTQGDRKSVV